MAKARQFKSPEAYRKWVAYGHMRTKEGGRAKKGQGVFETTPGHQKIKIGGKAHKVEHERKARKGLARKARGG